MSIFSSHPLVKMWPLKNTNYNQSRNSDVASSERFLPLCNAFVSTRTLSQVSYCCSKISMEASNASTDLRLEAAGFENRSEVSVGKILDACKQTDISNLTCRGLKVYNLVGGFETRFPSADSASLPLSSNAPSKELMSSASLDERVIKESVNCLNLPYSSNPKQQGFIDIHFFWKSY